MKRFSCDLVAAMLVSGGLLFAAAPVSAADGSAKSAKVKKHRVKVAKLKPDEDRVLHGSKETQTMRDSRLTRECRGAANAGACKGYTR